MTRYWNNEGKYQREYEALYEAYVPVMGSSDVLAGEAIRAVSKIYYDAYNNGFLNNTSGAWNWLDRKVRTPKMKEALSILQPCVNTGYYSKIDANVEQALEMMVDEAIHFAMIEENQKIKNPVDMLELDDPDEYCDDEDEEMESNS